MCGIVGALSPAPIEYKLVEEMRDLMIHRGPDHGGIWRSADRLVCLGHRRLAIVDLSAEANQPFISQDLRFVITFNGEIYNFRGLRAELMAEGVKFRTTSDTEVLVESFRRWGARCLDRLTGMFAFAIWDNLERKLFCARDRVGEKPFYYATVNGSFVFASELKALLGWGFQRKLDYQALIDYLSFGFVPDPKSIWENCKKLPPGHSLSLKMSRDGSLTSSTPVAYWDLEFDPDYSISDWGPRILNTLQGASKDMAFADVPVGTFLSGGVDSSSVTAALTKSGCDVKTFTVGFHESGFDERPWARKVASLYGTSHTERVVQEEDLSADLQRMVWHYDEPFNDYSYLPTYHVCREARKQITVALSGDGGDEVFAGYRKYQRLGLKQQVRRFLPQGWLKLLATGSNRLFADTNHLRQALVQYGLDCPSMLADMFVTGFSLESLRAAARGQLAQALKNYTSRDAIHPLLRQASPDKVGLINSMRYLDLKLTLSGDILVKVDRASMAVSLEVRPVYLHREIIALAAKIPPAKLADSRHSKEALKKALKSWLPDSILYRRKQGFAMPLASWINGKSRHLFASGTVPNYLDEFLDANILERTTNSHPSGRVNLTSTIHSLFFLNHWVNKWA